MTDRTSNSYEDPIETLTTVRQQPKSEDAIFHHSKMPCARDSGRSAEGTETRERRGVPPYGGWRSVAGVPAYTKNKKAAPLISSPHDIRTNHQPNTHIYNPHPICPSQVT